MESSSETPPPNRTLRSFLPFVLALMGPIVFGVLVYAYQDWLTVRYHAYRARMTGDVEALSIVMTVMEEEPDRDLMRWLIPTLDSTDFYAVGMVNDVPVSRANDLTAATGHMASRLLSNHTLAEWVEIGPESLPLIFDAHRQLNVNPELNWLRAIDALDPTGTALLAWAEQFESMPEELVYTMHSRNEFTKALIAADVQRGAALLAQWIKHPVTVSSPSGQQHTVSPALSARVVFNIDTRVSLEDAMYDPLVDMSGEDAIIRAWLLKESQPGGKLYDYAWIKPVVLDNNGKARIDMPPLFTMVIADAGIPVPPDTPAFFAGGALTDIETEEVSKKDLRLAGLYDSLPLRLPVCLTTSDSVWVGLRADDRVHDTVYSGEKRFIVKSGKTYRLPLHEGLTEGIADVMQMKYGDLVKP